MWDYIDIHSHLNFDRFDEDRDQVIKNLKKEQIATITIGTDFKTSQEAIELAHAHENLFAAIGIHPADNATESFSDAEFEKIVNDPKVVAIGECGLDYFRLPAESEAEKKRQKADFEQQIEFAVRNNLPLMIHCRDAYPDCLDILRSKKQSYGDKLKGNFHFFTSPIDIAKQCLEIDFSVSFTGPITYGADYDDVVKYVPLDKMHAETDAPFAAPVPFRGKRNEPVYVKEVVQKIAHIKGLDLEIVRKQLVNNAFELFLSKTLSSKS